MTAVRDRVQKAPEARLSREGRGCPAPESRPPDGRFDARGNHEGQCALIVDLHLGVPDAEGLKHFFGLPADRVAVVGFDPRLEFNRDAAALAGFDADVEIGADLCARVARFANAEFLSQLS